MSCACIVVEFIRFICILRFVTRELFARKEIIDAVQKGRYEVFVRTDGGAERRVLIQGTVSSI